MIAVPSPHEGSTALKVLLLLLVVLTVRVRASLLHESGLGLHDQMVREEVLQPATDGALVRVAGLRGDVHVGGPVPVGVDVHGGLVAPGVGPGDLLALALVVVVEVAAFTAATASPEEKIGKVMAALVNDSQGLLLLFATDQGDYDDKENRHDGGQAEDDVHLHGETEEEVVGPVICPLDVPKA